MPHLKMFDMMQIMKTRLTAFFNYTLLVVCTVDILATVGDSTLTWTSPMDSKLSSNDTSVNPLGKPITTNENSWMGSILNLGATIGPFPYVYIASSFGSKMGLLCIAIPHIISYLTLAFTTNIYCFYFARFIGGLSVGGGYALIPMYIAEISRNDNRGAMCLTLNVFWATGNFLPYAMGPFLSTWLFNSILAMIAISFVLLFPIIGVETPYYLEQVGRQEEAEDSLMLLRSLGREEIQEELRSIQIYLELSEDGHLSDIIKDKHLRKAFIICMVLVAAQQLSGFSALTYHLQLIFESAGTDISPDVSAVIVGFALLVSSFISPFLVDRAGRRPLIIYSCLGMCVCQMMLGVFFYLHDSMHIVSGAIQWIPISSLIFYIIFFNLGMCPVPWTLVSELFPNNLKTIVASATSSFCFFISFIIILIFDDMNYSMGQSGTFCLFGGLCFCCAIFAIIFVPETKGKSFSEIQDILREIKI